MCGVLSDGFKQTFSILSIHTVADKKKVPVPFV